jgi:hypothetical protein
VGAAQPGCDIAGCGVLIGGSVLTVFAHGLEGSSTSTKCRAKRAKIFSRRAFARSSIGRLTV